MESDEVDASFPILPSHLVNHQEDIDESPPVLSDSSSPVFGKVLKRRSEEEPETPRLPLKKNRKTDEFSNDPLATKQKRTSHAREKRGIALNRLVQKRQKRATVLVANSEDDSEDQSEKQDVVLDSGDSDIELQSFLKDASELTALASATCSNRESSSDIDDEDLDELMSSFRRGETDKCDIKHDVLTSTSHKSKTKDVVCPRKKAVASRYLNGLISSDSEIDSDEDFLLTLSSAPKHSSSNESSPDNGIVHRSKNCPNHDNKVQKTKNFKDPISKHYKEKNNSKLKRTTCSDKNILDKNQRKFRFKTKDSEQSKSKMGHPSRDNREDNPGKHQEQKIENIRTHKFSFMSTGSQRPTNDASPSADDDTGGMSTESPDTNNDCFYRNSHIKTGNDEADFDIDGITNEELLNVYDNLNHIENNPEVIEILDSPAVFPKSRTKNNKTNHHLDGFTSASRFYTNTQQSKDRTNKHKVKSARKTENSAATLTASHSAGFSGMNDESLDWLNQPFSNSGGRKRSKTPKRSKPSTSTGGRTDSPNPVAAVEQMESDEAMAKRLQEEMDLEYAASLAENQPAEPLPVEHNHYNHMHALPQVPGFHPYENILSFPHTIPSFVGETSPRRMRRSRRAGPPQTAQDEDLSFFELYNAMLHGQALTRGRGRRRGRAPRFVLNSFHGDDTEGNDYEQLLELAENLGEVIKKGLSSSQIDCLPTRAYTPGSARPDSTVPECHVCMCEYKAGEQIRILTCFHEFHTNCIDKWLKENATCPVCRVEVTLS